MPRWGLVGRVSPCSPANSGLMSRAPALLAGCPSEAGPGVGQHCSVDTVGVALSSASLSSAVYVDRPVRRGAVVSTFWEDEGFRLGEVE